MATSDSTVTYILDQLSLLEGIGARKMFGEYGLSYEGKPVGVICNDTLYIKATEAGRKQVPGLAEAPPYRGAKPALVIDGDLLEDRERLAALVGVTARALPEPKPKRRKA